MTSKMCPSSHPHDLTSTCYSAHGCRCWPCRRAASAARRGRAFVDERTPAGPVRAHVRLLHFGGANRSQIAGAAGVSVAIVRKLLSADRVVTVDRAAAARLLALTPSVAFDHPWRGMIRAQGSRRRVQALLYLGWTVSGLVRVTSVPRMVFTSALQARWIRVERAQLISAVHARLWSTPPTPGRDLPAAEIARARVDARERGFASTLAWNDVDHDFAPRALRRAA